MKFPRNARLLRSPFDVAPFAAVFFLLVIFLMLGGLVYTPGVRIEPPLADGLPGTDQPTVAVAVDAGGRYYFANQIVSEEQLTNDLRAAAKKSREPLTLVIHADKAVTYDQLIRLMLLARDAGIHNALGATLPRVINTPASHERFACRFARAWACRAGAARRRRVAAQPLADAHRAGFRRCTSGCFSCSARENRLSIVP